MVDVRVDTINDTHRLVRVGDVGLHSNRAVLDIVHELFLFKRPLFLYSYRAWYGSVLPSGQAVTFGPNIIQENDRGLPWSTHKHGRV